MGESIRCGAQVIFNDILGKWQRCDQPQYMGTDYPYLVGPWNMSETDATGGGDARNNIVALPAEEVIALRGIWVPTSPATTTGASWSQPVIPWIQAEGEYATYNDTVNNVGINAVYSYTPLKRETLIHDYGTGTGWYLGNGSMYAPVCTQGLLCNLILGNPFFYGTPYGYTYSDGGFLWRAVWRVATQDCNTNPDRIVRWYQVSIEMDYKVVLSYRDASLNELIAEIGTMAAWGAWHQIDQLVTYSAGTPQQSMSNITVQFEIFAGKLKVCMPQLGGNITPYITPADNGETVFTLGRDPAIGNAIYCIWVAGREYFKGKIPRPATYASDLTENYLRTSLYVKKYPLSATSEYADHQLGFSPLNLPFLSLDYGAPLPSGTSVTATLLDPVTAKYQLTLSGSAKTHTFNGVDICDFTPTVRAVTYTYAPIYSHQISFPVVAEPQRLHVSHRFDYNSLQIHSSVDLEFNNNNGQYAAIFRDMGQKSAEINLFSTHFSNGMPFRQFTGVIGRKASIEGAQGACTYTMKGGDRSIQVDNPRWDLPWMDGWSEMYFQAYLSCLSGIHPSDLAYLPYVPVSPFGIDLGDETGSPAWFLPVGAAGTPLTRFSGVSLWQIKAKLAQTIGKMLFYDVYGKEQYLKFRGTNLAVKRAYFEGDEYGPLGIQHILAGKSLEDVRNQITVIGIDAFGPLWSPIVAHQSDQASIRDSAAFNHIGWEQPFVWADNLFANLAFAANASQQLINFLRLPSITTTFTTHLNPDLYPLDTISVQCPRVGLSGLRLMVVGVDHLVHDGTLGETMITARWLGD